MPLNKNIKKVLVIGSGPIVIGQAAEFDYSGTQACQALKEEGIEVVLVNSNPATIMTDREVADKIYIEPLTLEFVEKVIAKERPDSLLAGFEFLLVSEKEITFQSLLEISNIKNELMIKFKNQGFYTSISNQGALIINTDDFYIILLYKFANF